MKTKENYFTFFIINDRYDPDKLEYDKQLVTQFYNNNGFPDFKFVSSIAQLSPNSNDFEIILSVSEVKNMNLEKLVLSVSLKN